MSDLHPSDHVVLLRAGFTEREISTHMRKFVNLTTIHPCLTFEKRQFDALMSDRRALLDALKSIVERAELVYGASPATLAPARAVIDRVQGETP